MQDHNQTVLRISNINISFGGVQALIEVSFEAYQGEILAIIGPNGAGKTTMLNCINGFYRADPGGSIVYRDRELMGMKILPLETVNLKTKCLLAGWRISTIPVL